MAVVGPAEARVACPACGGLIHPIAGRCKHCRTDLAALRAAAPTAAAAAPIALPVRTRPPAPASRSALRNWPVLVIAIAGLAIVGATILLVWPGHHDDAAISHVPPPPAPEHMDTQALPPVPSPSPTPTPTPHAQVAPPAGGADDIDNPFDQGMPSHIGPNAAAFQATLMQHLCDRLSQCQPAGPLTGLCSVNGVAGATDPPQCPAARQCLQMIDGLGCNAGVDAASLLSIYSQVHSCMEALSC